MGPASFTNAAERAAPRAAKPDGGHDDPHPVMSQDFVDGRSHDFVAT